MNENFITRFEHAVQILVELEAMKAANIERMANGESLAYGEEQILELLK